MVDATVKPYVTFADYVESERTSDVKHEWFNGAVYAMSRGTPEHARLSARILRLLGNALPADCEAFSGDLMLYVAEVNLSTYADGSVICGQLETINVRRDGKSLGEGATNPVVIIEVLSDSTERYSREEKFAYYRSLPSLHEYVLVSQDQPVIEVFRRPDTDVARGGLVSTGSRARWDSEVARTGGSVKVHGCAIDVDSVYGKR